MCPTFFNDPLYITTPFSVYIGLNYTTMTMHVHTICNIVWQIISKDNTLTE